MHAEMAEEASASPSSPRRTLLDKIGTSDVFILILGPRYGDVGESGFSPTEDEFNEAIRLGRDVLVFVQEVEMEADQREFLDRVRGAWEDGRFYRRFTDVSDIGLAIAGALSELRAGSPGEDPQAASQRALELANGKERSGMSSGLSVRVAFMPLRQGVVLDAVGLEDAALEDDLSQMLRQAGLGPGPGHRDGHHGNRGQSPRNRSQGLGPTSGIRAYRRQHHGERRDSRGRGIRGLACGP